MQDVKIAFAQELSKSEPELNLGYAALLISQYFHPSFHPFLREKIYLNVFDDMAKSVHPFIKLAQTEIKIISVLNRFLFQELQFSGNKANYYHPDNSFLDKVLDLRMGIPISLSVIYLEIGWRLKLPLVGVGLPGHFIVAYNTHQTPLYIDVFNEGRLLTENDCMDLCHITEDDRLLFQQTYLKPVSKTAILYRILLNLKQIYVALEDWQAAYKTVDLMTVIHPEQADELRDRGLIAYRLGNLQDAIFDIKQYLLKSPLSPDANWLNRHVELMENKLLRLN